MATSNPNTGDAFPSFLDTDPFPSNERRRGSDASGTTDATSALGNDSSPSIPANTGPVGEPGLPPSRLATGGNVTSTQKRSALSSSTPRRNLAAALVGKGAGDGDHAAEPAKATTHVPSLAAQGFFRPMSGQKLQSQRAVRSPPPGKGSLGGLVEGNDTSAEPARRNSNASINTLRDRMPPTRDGQQPPLPSSRGTDRNAYGDGMAAGSILSDGSAAPLSGWSQGGGLRVNTSNQRGMTAQSGPKSPRSFRASLGLGSRRTSRQDPGLQSMPGQHEKLHSYPSSPHDEKEGMNAFGANGKRSKSRNYEFFAGNLIFFVEGRCLNTKAKPLNVLTFVLTAAQSALFFAFSAPWLWHNVSPALPIVFGYVFYVALSSFLHAALSDPGILPRNIHPHPPNPAEEDPWTLGPPTTEWVMVRTFPSKHAPKISDPEQGGPDGAATAMEVPTKYCKSCNIWRPPRAHHCRVCDACIETQDHHCVWLNNCVGRRNYRFFFAFIGFASILALMLLAFSLLHVILYGSRNGLSFAESLTGRLQERVAFAMFIYSIIALPYPGSLWVYHMFLTSRGETTREYLNSHKFLPKDRHRPFTQTSWWQNLLVVLMRPRSPSYMSFKSRYEPGDLRFGHVESKKDRKKNLKQRYSATRDDIEKHEMSSIPPMSAQSKQLTSQMSGGPTLNRPFNNTPR